VAPVAPAGPGTATGTGATTACGWHAASVIAATATEKIIAYFMCIPIDRETAYPDRNLHEAQFSC
jgi:hypothetical protein